HDVDIVLHAGVHDPAREEPLANSTSDAAGFPNSIYRAELIFVSAACDRDVGIQSQRRSKQRALNVVSGKRVSGEEPIDVLSFNQSNQISACACAHDGRSRDNCDFTASATNASQFFGDLANDGRFGFLGVYDVVDELKWVCVRSGSLHWHNTDPLVSDNNPVAFFDIEKLNRSRTALLPVNGDGAINDPGRHLDLLTVEANKSLLVGSDVELEWEHTVSWSGGNLSVCPLHYFGALLAKTQDELVQRFACFGGHFDSGKALIRAFPADLDFSDFEVPAVRQNLVEHLWQDERINDVTA